ncbi:hypothetical protein YC2023_054051 [Brassica napus]
MSQHQYVWYNLESMLSKNNFLNLLEASEDSKQKQHDVFCLFASMDCPDTVYCGFQYFLEYNILILSTETAMPWRRPEDIKTP